MAAVVLFVHGDVLGIFLVDDAGLDIANDVRSLVPDEVVVLVSGHVATSALTFIFRHTVLLQFCCQCLNSS